MSFFLLKEDGSHLLFESGDKIILEQAIPEATDETYFRRYLNDVEIRDSIVAIALPTAPEQSSYEGYVLEEDGTTGILLEDGSGLLLIENNPDDDYFRRYLNDTLYRDN